MSNDGKDVDDTSDDETPLVPLGTEEEFAAIVRDMCVESAPRRFAVVEVIGDREDAEVVAWGQARPDEAVVTDVNGRLVGWFGSAERALRFFRAHPVRLVWIDPAPQPDEALA